MTPGDHPSATPGSPATTGRAYWRSLDEYTEKPEFQAFLEREFPAAVPDLISEGTRRTFMKLMGASAGLAGLVGCRWPRENILPYSRRPEGRIPGKPVHYATSFELDGVATGLLVKSFDGRPIKVEGNPDHPGSLGGSDAIEQAAILEMYDPDRTRNIIRRSASQRRVSDWLAFDTFAGERFGALAGARGRGLAILHGTTSSPTFARLREQLRGRFPQALWCEYEAASRDGERAGSTLAFGRPHRAVAAFDRAEVIVTFDADPLGIHPNRVRHARDWATGRTADQGTMSRLYAVEADFSLTGSVADHRLAVRSTDVGKVAVALAARLAVAGDLDGIPGGVREAIAGGEHGEHADFVGAMVDDLLAHRGRSLLLAGPRQPAEVHALCHVLNRALGNVGATVTYVEEPDPDRPSHVEGLAELTRVMRNREVHTLVILDSNPVYTAPHDVPFVEALEYVEEVIHLGLFEDETAEHATWHLPRAHFLEAWGDARAWDGTFSIVQPLIEPLYEGRSPLEMLSFLAGNTHPRGYDLVRETFADVVSDDDSRWRHALHDGVVNEATLPTTTPSIGGDVATALRGFRPGHDGSGIEVILRPDAKVWDGRFANVGWLQEMPDPMSTITWDNAALVSYADAERWGVKPGDMITVKVGERRMDIATYVLPGQATGTITLPLGYGRTRAGRVGNGVGFNTYGFRTTAAPDVMVGEVTPAAGRYDLAVTQDHFAIDVVGLESRAARLGELFREADLESYKAHPEFAKHVVHHNPLKSLFTEWTYAGHKWGMSIDLSTCIGCNACLVACQAENNIAIVGKEQVAKGREMHWIRVDRYFVGDPESPDIAHQPVTCQQCENAPCEQVCPVAATLHDAEGLNVMVYNRCIGTRYCLNNCPYKVRRFNFHNNMKYLTPTHEMAHNPEVTVRSRGVMEKCSYCLQRIKAVTIDAQNENRAVRDGEILTACQQSCPTGAITFGDLNDPQSRAAALRDHDRSYAMLGELNVKPRTTYLAKLRNPSAALQPVGQMHGGHATGHENGPGGSSAGHDQDGHAEEESGH
jgi:molybdopterin-containing oxidoreductase family iron-sulfur binding subunit